MNKPTHTAAGRVLACALTTAVLCGTTVEVQAADGVQLYGLVGSYIGSIKRSDSVDRITQVGSGGLTTSWWGIKGTESLGNGVNAVFMLEQFFQPDTGGAGRSTADPTGFSRNGWVGLSGAFGQLTIGRHTSPYYVSMQQVNPFGSSVVFSPLVVQSYVAAFSNTVIGDTVWSNAIQYVAPTVNGFSTTVIYAPGEVAGSDKVNNAGIHFRYNLGKLTAVFSAQRVRTAAIAPSTGQEAYLAGANYDAGFAKFYASAQMTENADTNVSSKTWQLGESIPVTATGSILASIARTTVDNPKLSVGAHTTAGLGYDYFLSKRTDVYATYLYDHIVDKVKGNSYALGIRHTF
jgi:predicted porin